MGARNRAGTGLSYRPARLRVEWIPWKRILGFLKSLKFGLSLASALTVWKYVQYSISPFTDPEQFAATKFHLLWCKFKIHSYQIREHRAENLRPAMGRGINSRNRVWN
jgi:hypothetical protein